jgi:hypothetical protein
VIRFPVFFCCSATYRRKLRYPFDVWRRLKVCASPFALLSAAAVGDGGSVPFGTIRALGQVAWPSSILDQCLDVAEQLGRFLRGLSGQFGGCAAVYGGGGVVGPECDLCRRHAADGCELSDGTGRHPGPGRNLRQDEHPARVLRQAVRDRCDQPAVVPCGSRSASAVYTPLRCHNALSHTHRTGPMDAIATLPAPTLPSLLIGEDLEAAAEFLIAQKSAATLAAHRSGFRIFVSYCTARGLAAMPAMAETVMGFFLSAEAKGGAKASTPGPSRGCRQVHAQTGRPRTADEQ